LLKVPFVCGTDYFAANQFIEDSYQATALQQIPVQQLLQPQFHVDRDKFYHPVWNKPSVIGFRKLFIAQEDYLYLWPQIAQPIPTEHFLRKSKFTLLYIE
jgi:hypothetical protein